ncbi:hypothetical protein J8J14_14810 [Roseomonas sp. SSH11]|uniref:Uncharacterized protein n=1 Tax=Pararoseomonas baculiformis TaxID=2820812 RepID=A0ABS4AG89_9PROT|nr:hypothetical protein [Pararoseomonas baculiformis]MBP0446046.1 hypothetical protein [Pararoseomonas baculiformis]
MRNLVLALLAAGGLACNAIPTAVAQQYWLPNGSGGTTFNNPQGSLLGTANERMLQQHMQRQQMQGRSGASSSAGAATQAPQAAAASQDPSFRLGNRGKQTIQEVYVSSASESHWGRDQLGQDILNPGARVIIRLPHGQCLNDIRVVYAGGQAEERRGVNTCALTDLSFP